MAKLEAGVNIELGIEPLILEWINPNAVTIKGSQIAYAIGQTLVSYVRRMGGLSDADTAIMTKAKDVLQGVNELWYEYQSPNKPSSLEWMATREALYGRPEVVYACLLGRPDSSVALGTRAVAHLNYARYNGYPIDRDTYHYSGGLLILRGPNEYNPLSSYPRGMADHFMSGLIYLARAIVPQEQVV